MTALAQSQFAQDVQSKGFLGGEIPNTDSVAALPRKHRVSAKKVAKFIWDQYQAGLRQRRTHAILWMKVDSIMEGYHYFHIRGGRRVIIPKKQGEIRAVVPVMKPHFRRELGRLNSNLVGVTAIPKTGRGAEAYYKARTAQGAMDTWMQETEFPAIYDEANQYLLMYGTVGYYHYMDSFRQQVFVRAVPGPQIFPIPFDARSPSELDGIMRVHLVSKGWLEMQDAKFEAQFGQPPEKRMAERSKSRSSNLTTQSAHFGATGDPDGSIEGALAVRTWMKPNEQNPGGEDIFMLGEEMFRYQGGMGEDGKPVLFGGRLPIELVYYTKQANSFLGYGFCEDLISPQLEANRQRTAILKHALLNRPIVAYNDEAFDAKDIQGEIESLIPYKSGAYEDNRPPLISVPGASVSRDTIIVEQLVREDADRAAGFESEIVFGRQEGRTEGGPATSLLNANAQTPLQPVLERISRALHNTYAAVLDMLKVTWPPEKAIRIKGVQNFVREQVINTREQLPDSQEVVLKPIALLAGGRHEMLNLLYRLRTMPSENGTIGGELSSREFRRALAALGYDPPGMEMVDEAEQRILVRIEMLINDGQEPAAPPAPRTPDLASQSGAFHVLVLEDHHMAVRLLKQAILDPAYMRYSPQVQNALIEEIQFHQGQLGGIVTPQNVDDDSDVMAMQQQERFLQIAEDDPETLEGVMNIQGVPVGV